MLANRIFMDQYGEYFILMHSDAIAGKQSTLPIKMDKEAVQELIQKGDLVPDSNACGNWYFRLKSHKRTKNEHLILTH